jgi:hypothetical protein
MLGSFGNRLGFMAIHRADGNALEHLAVTRRMQALAFAV